MGTTSDFDRRNLTNIGKHFKNEAEELAEFMELYSSDNPHVTDENGNWMTKYQVVERTRNGWKDTAREKGWSEAEIAMM